MRHEITQAGSLADARWDGDSPPEPAYAEDAHAEQYDRILPQFDARRFAGRVMEMLP